MGFIDEKQNIIDEVAVYKTLNFLPESKKTSSFESVDSKSKNVMPFLLDLLEVTSSDVFKKKEDNKNDDDEFGVNSSDEPSTSTVKKKKFFKNEENGGFNLKKPESEIGKLLLSILTEFTPSLSRILVDGIIIALKQSLNCGSDFKIPSVTLDIDLDTIDFNNILKSTPENVLKGGIYFTNTGKDFNKFLVDTIKTPNVKKTWNYNSVGILDVTYNKPSKIKFQVNNAYKDEKFNKFILDFFKSLDLLDSKMLIGGIVDSFFANVTSNLDLSLDQLVNKEKTNTLIDKILDTDPEDEVIFDNSFYQFNNDELQKIEEKANESKLGETTLDLGCGLFGFNINNDSTNNNVSKYLDELSELSEPKLVEDVVVKLLDNVGTITSNVSPQNGGSIKNKLFKDFIQDLPKVIINNIVLTPKILGIFKLAEKMVNDVNTTTSGVGVTVNQETNSFDWAKANKIFFEYVVRESLAALLQIIYNRLRILLLEIIQSFVSRLISEIASKRLSIILSYISSVRGIINQIPTPNIVNYK